MTDITAAPPDTAASNGNALYPWQVLIGLSLCIFALMGVSVYGFIILVSSLAADMHWSAAQSGGLVSAMWCAAPLALFGTPLVVRFGPWRLAVASLLIQAISLWALAYVDQFWQLYLLRLFTGTGKVILVTSAPVIIAQYFSTRFATAISLFWAAAVGAGLVFAPLTEHLVESMGWRSAAHTLALLVVSGLPVTWLLYRVGRAKYLARAVGDTAANAVNVEALTQVAGSAWGQLARRMGPVTMAVTGLAIVGMGAANISVFSHEMTYLSQLGFSSAFGANALALLSAVAILGSVVVGRLLDARPAVYSATLIGIGVYGGFSLLLCLLSVSSGQLAMIASGMLGFAMAGGEVLWMNLARLMAPRAIFATSYGGWYFSMQVGYAIGGSLGGLSLDRYGGIGLVLTMMALYVPATIMGVRLALRGPAEDNR
jgi:predicted MFS family arabinose efflux permease